MLELAGDVDGHRVLDAGCGPGFLAAALRARGAQVTGFDASPAMVDLARNSWETTRPSILPTSPNPCLSTTPSLTT